MAAGSGGSVRQVENIFHLLESSETERDIREAIAENLYLTKEPWLIPLLVDYFFQTQSTNVMEILAELPETHAKTLIDKLQESIKISSTRLPSLQLLLNLVYKELPWCHRLVETPLFSAVLKCMEVELDVPILMTGVMTVVILLPSVPVSMGPYLPRIFDIFRRLAVFCVKKPANTPEVFILHLQVALYSLFQRLYGMYPCSFISFISKFYSNKENIHVFEEILMPMLERVRLHPKLVTGQHEVETSANRWKNQETHDIIVNCSKLSLDLIEGTWEDSGCPVFRTLQLVDKYRQLNLDFPYGRKAKAISEPQTVTKTADDLASLNSLYVPSLDAVGESPSVLIGLSTPPLSQRTTPATTVVEHGPTTSTTATPRQLTPCLIDEGEKTSLSRSSSRGTFQQSKSIEVRRSGLIDSKAIIPVPHTTPVTPGSQSFSSPTPYSPMGTVDSPLRSKSSAFVTPLHLRSPAARNLQFDLSVEEEKEDAAEECTAGSGQEEAQMNPDPHLPRPAPDSGLKVQNSVGLPVESLQRIIGDISTPDTEKLDQEVEAINEQVDRFPECTSHSSSVSTLASQTDITAESVRQFMKKVNRIRFNSLTSNSSSDFDAVSVTQVAPDQRARRPRSCPPLKRHKLAAGDSINQTRPGQYQASPDQKRPGQAVGRQISAAESRPGAICLRPDNSCEDVASCDTGSMTETSMTSTSQLRGPQPDTGPATVDFTPPLPAAVNPVFQFIFAPSKLLVCCNCHQQVLVASDQPRTVPSASEQPRTVPSASCQPRTVPSASDQPRTVPSASDQPRTVPLTATTAFTGNEVSLFSLMSPPELLDRHLRLGSDLHAKELTKIPLTSRESTNWTHFGGVPPVDEVNILRGQILLIQNQLMYERHKRSNHAKRNRRLLRRITHTTMLEEQQKTLLEQVELQERQIQQLKVSLKLLQEDNRVLRQSQESDQYEKLVHFRTALKENKDLKAASVVLKNLLVTQKEENDKQQKKLDCVEHKNLENQKELEMIREKVARTDKLSQMVFQLQKEVLLTQEFHQKCQEQLGQARASTRHKVEESLLIQSLKAEIADLIKDNKKKSNLLEAYHTRLIELEEQLRAKDNTIIEIKRNLEEAKSSHREQLKAVEERCGSLVHTSQQLEAKVMELTGLLDQAVHNQMQRATKKLGSGEAGIESGAGHSSEMPAGLIDHSTSVTRPATVTSLTQAVGGSDLTLSQTSPSSGLAVEAKWDPEFGTGRPQWSSHNSEEARVIVAKASMCVASSTFREESCPAIQHDQLAPIQDGLDSDTLSDSGAASRTSYRVDSDISLHSASGHSLVTGDSGCWPKD